MKLFLTFSTERKGAWEPDECRSELSNRVFKILSKIEFLIAIKIIRSLLSSEEQKKW